MSRTTKDDKKRGPLAYGKGTKQRAIGYEFWGRRSVVSGLRDPGSDTKKRTSRAERRKTHVCLRCEGTGTRLGDMPCYGCNGSGVIP